jgi:type VI secretion system secreted protein VgrG
MIERNVWVDCPLGPDKLRFRGMLGREEVGRPFEFTLEVHTEDPSLEVNDLLGLTATVHVPLADGSERFFHGHIVEMAEAGESGSFVVYQMKLRPTFALLNYNSNCRIFQDKSVLEIIEELFKEQGLAHYESRLTEKTYRKYEYCVQYRESDFGFISRLLEQEGIYYFFRHESDKHILVLADGPESHEDFKHPDIRFVLQAETLIVEEHLDRWAFARRLQPGAFVYDDYDFKRPRATLTSKLAAPLPHAHAEYEVFDYPGEYVQEKEGETLVRARLQQLHAQFERMTGSGNVRSLATGQTFKMYGHPRTDQNQQYVLLSVTYTIAAAEHESGEGESGPTFRCDVSAMKASTPFRPAFVTPRPYISGHQTAVVVGKDGEEIWTDEFGRVKLQFRWDRFGKSNEQSSCWVRVAQVWAGNSWGAIHVPRIGQEVLVSFLEGDPDRPVVTGRVYNGGAKPPFELPDHAMVSGIKSDSTPGGGGYNEISMDDTKSKEKLTMHAQKDMHTTVENDQALTVHHNRTSTVDNDEQATVGNNQTVSIGKDQTIDIGENRRITVHANHEEKVVENKSVSVDKNLAVVVTGDASEKVDGEKSVTVKKDSHEAVSGAKTTKVSKDAKEEIGQNMLIKTGKNLTLDASGELSISGKKSGVIELSDQLTVKVGGATLVLKKNGDIVLNGTKISVTGKADVAIKGMKVTQN